MRRKYQGHSLDELPFKAAFGVTGSYICAVMNFLCLAAQFYVALWPVGGPNYNVVDFFQAYLAAPFILVLYIMWKAYSFFAVPEHRPLYVKIKDIDVYTGMREGQVELISGVHLNPEERKESIIELQQERRKGGVVGWAKAFVTSVI